MSTKRLAEFTFHAAGRKCGVGLECALFESTEDLNEGIRQRSVVLPIRNDLIQTSSHLDTVLTKCSQLGSSLELAFADLLGVRAEMRQLNARTKSVVSKSAERRKLTEELPNTTTRSALGKRKLPMTDAAVGFSAKRRLDLTKLRSNDDENAENNGVTAVDDESNSVEVEGTLSSTSPEETLEEQKKPASFIPPPPPLPRIDSSSFVTPRKTISLSKVASLTPTCAFATSCKLEAKPNPPALDLSELSRVKLRPINGLSVNDVPRAKGDSDEDDEKSKPKNDSVLAAMLKFLAASTQFQSLQRQNQLQEEEEKEDESNPSLMESCGAAAANEDGWQ